MFSHTFNEIILFFFQIMDAIKGTMTEMYNDLSKGSSGNTIGEVRVYSGLWRD